MSTGSGSRKGGGSKPKSTLERGSTIPTPTGSSPSPRQLAAAVPSAIRAVCSAPCVDDVSSTSCAEGVEASIVESTSECCDAASGVAAAPAPAAPVERGGSAAGVADFSAGDARVAVAVSPGAFVGAASLAAATTAEGRPKTSPRSVLDLEGGLCGEADVVDDRLYAEKGRDAARRSVPEPSPRLDDTKPLVSSGSSSSSSLIAASSSGSRDRADSGDAEFARRFEEAFEAFLEQRRQLKRTSSDRGQLLPSASEIEELRARLLRATSERARTEAELRSQLAEVERSRSEMEARLRRELEEARRAKEKTEAELKGQITKAVVERAAVAERGRRRPPQPRRRSPPSSIRSPPRAPSHRTGAGGGGRNDMIGMAVRDTEAALRNLQRRRGRSMPPMKVTMRDTDQGEARRAPPPSITQVPTSIDWDDETISTVWAADSALEDALAELRAGRRHPS